MMHPADVMLGEQLEALRRLPPGTEPTRVPGTLAASVVGALRAAPIETSALQFVESDLSEQTVLLALAQVLGRVPTALTLQSGALVERQAALSEAVGPERATELFASAPSNESRRAGLEERFRSIVGDLINIQRPEQWPASWSDTVEPRTARQRLTEAWQWYWERSGLASTQATNWSLGTACQYCLIADLLRLPAGADPVAWLQSERRRESTWIAALCVAYGAFPAQRSNPLSDAPPTRAPITLKAKGKVSGLAVEVRSIDFDMAADRFAVQLAMRCRVPEHLVRQAEASWSQDGWRRAGRARGTQTIVCSPAPGSDVTRLLIEDDPAIVTLERDCTCGNTVAPLPAAPLGHLRIEVRLDG